MKKGIMIVLISLLMSMLLFSHSGRTDSKGGHRNRKTGGYHYHNGGSRGRSSGSGCRLFSLTEDVVSYN